MGKKNKFKNPNGTDKKPSTTDAAASAAVSKPQPGPSTVTPQQSTSIGPRGDEPSLRKKSESQIKLIVPFELSVLQPKGGHVQTQQRKDQILVGPGGDQALPFKKQQKQKEQVSSQSKDQGGQQDAWQSPDNFFKQCKDQVGQEVSMQSSYKQSKDQVSQQVSSQTPYKQSKDKVGQQVSSQSPYKQSKDKVGQQSKSQGSSQQSKDQGFAQQSKGSGWGQPKVQGWRQQPIQTAWAQPSVQQGWGQSSKDEDSRKSAKSSVIPKIEEIRSPSKQIKPQSQGQRGQVTKPHPDKPAVTDSSKMLVSPSYDVSTKRGTRGKIIRLEANYVKLILDKIAKLAYQYDIKFDPDKPKRYMRPAFDEYCRRVNMPCKLAFDGRSIVFSPKKLENEYCTTVEVKVTDPESDSNIVKNIKVTLALTNVSEIQLDSLKNYHNIPIYDQPQRALQCVDVVLRSAFINKGTRSGRSIYSEPRQVLDLEDGFEMWYGLFQSAVLGSQPFLNIDVCHRAFPSPRYLIDLCYTYSRYFDPNKPFDRYVDRSLQTHLSGLKIIYEPPACFNAQPKRYGFNRILLPSNQQKCEIEGKQTCVAEYFRSRGYILKYPNLPCLHVGARDKTNYIPMELCKLPGGQISMKKTGQNQVRNLIKYAAVPTPKRKQNILDQFTRLNHNADETIRSFGIQVGNNFITIPGRVLESPSLEYGNKEINVHHGKWDSGRERADFIMQSTITFGILVMDSKCTTQDGTFLAKEIIRHGNFGGLTINPKYQIFKINEDRNEKNTFAKYMSDFKNIFKTNIVFVIISNFNYAKVKQWAEIECGVLTQCIKSITVSKRLNPSTIQNILLKVNAKTNGLNHKIAKRSETEIMQKQDVMYIGADVTHPSPDQRNIPSVVGVAASHDLYGFKYNMQWRLQDPKQEIIDNMSDIMVTHLRTYNKANNNLPKKIIYYRDGVSDGQLTQVRDLELNGFDKAFLQMYGNQPKPKVTCLIVQKRHHTRFFPTKSDEFGKFQNVPPGTIVDQEITHPNECQFFLVSHESIQGTAKPTKYIVIRDDSNYNIDDLQAITNNMCHMFTRCNRAVSYPAPAYYAHLVAARGRVYIEGHDINLRKLDREYQDRTIHSDIVNNYPMYFT